MKYRHLDMLQKILDTLRPAVIALIAAAGLTIIGTAFFGKASFSSFDQINPSMVLLFGISLFLMVKKKMNPITVMVLAGVLRVAQGMLIL